MEENLGSGSDSPSGDFLAKKGAGHLLLMCQLSNDAFMTRSLEKNTLTSFLTLKSSLRRLPRRRLPPPAESPPLLESE